MGNRKAARSRRPPDVAVPMPHSGGEMAEEPGRRPAERPGPGPRREFVPRPLPPLRSDGRALPAGVRGSLERSFGADFAGVRAHTGEHAHRLTLQAGALALTRGSDIFFRAGAFQPDTRQGRYLLGHELTHVVQHQQGRVPGAGSHGSVAFHPRLESEAQAAASRAAQGRPAGIPASPAQGFQPSTMPMPFLPYFFRVPVEENRQLRYADDYNPFSAQAFNLDYLGLEPPPQSDEKDLQSADDKKAGEAEKARSVHQSNQDAKAPGNYPGESVDAPIPESTAAIDMGQALITQMREYGLDSLKQGDLQDTGYMIGVMQADQKFILASSGYATPGFKQAVSDLKGDSNKIEMATIDRNPDRAAAIQLTTFGGASVNVQQQANGNLPAVCAAPKAFLQARHDQLIPRSLTEILYDPNGDNPVMVHGTRYHHRERVPSCTTCEAQLPAMLAGLGAWIEQTLQTRQKNEEARRKWAAQQREQEEKKARQADRGINPFSLLADAVSSDSGSGGKKKKNKNKNKRKKTQGGSSSSAAAAATSAELEEDDQDQGPDEDDDQVPEQDEVEVALVPAAANQSARQRRGGQSQAVQQQAPLQAQQQQQLVVRQGMSMMTLLLLFLLLLIVLAAFWIGYAR